MVQNAWLFLVAGALLVITRTVDFAPPPTVRVGPPDAGSLVGDSQTQEFARFLPNPQTVQLRATLRWYEGNDEPLLDPDPVDERGKILAQPVVTTILGMNAAIDQTVRLEGGELEVDVSLQATPRLERAAEGRAALVLEHQVSVHSRRDLWWRRAPRHTLHFETRDFLTGLDEHPHRLLFAIDEHRFSLELETHRPRVGANPP